MTHKLIRRIIGNPQTTSTITISQEARKFFHDPDFVITGRRTEMQNEHRETQGS